jgi:OST-HTH/LOTUS domain
MERVAGIKTPAVPKSVVNVLRQILHSRPDGVSLSVLRDELRRKKILSDHLFGFQKFSSLIYSLPDIFTLISPPDSKKEPYVVLTRKRSAKLVNDPVESPRPKESAEPAEPAEPEQVLRTGQQNFVFL